jgi:hypothetical protein
MKKINVLQNKNRVISFMFFQENESLASISILKKLNLVMFENFKNKKLIVCTKLMGTNGCTYTV